MLGVFEKTARPWDVTKHRQGADWNQIKEEHWMHLEPYIRAALRRMPILKETPYDFLINTPDAFTPDGRWILGETPEVANYFVCAGMNGNSLQGAGGVGRAVADWIVDGLAPKHMLRFEVQRFTSLHNNSRFLYERSREVVGRHYQLHYPIVNEFQYGRKIRTSPIYSELEARGAVFGERMGWERALYFNPSHHREDPPSELPAGTWKKPEFIDQIEDEYHVCREGVGLMDMSSFAKFIIRGEEKSLINYLQMLCSNDVDVPVGSCVSTGMQNEKGGYENDCLLIRKREDAFFMVSPTQQQTRILEWMDNHLPEDNSISLQDVTSMYTVLSLVGPKSKDLMEEMSGSDMTMEPLTFKEVNVGYASGVMVLAVTNTGEPGYSLYIPSEFALQIYDNFMKIGRDYGIRNVGHLAMRMARIEKFIPFWGEELTADTTPNESNKMFKVKFDKEYFIGKEALLKQREEGVFKRLVQFQLEEFNKDEDVWPWGGEAIYRNGEFVGFTSSTSYGFTLQKMIALGFVRHPASMAGKMTPLDEDWLSDSTAKWAIDVNESSNKVNMASRDAEIEKPLGGATKMGKVPKMAKVKNKAPAELQITAEQLLREAKERELEIVPPPPKQKIQDEEELRDFQMRKRKNFEDAIRKNRSVLTNWIKYATWEESQGVLDRTRSVYERALDVDHRNIGLWLKYTEMEMRNKQVNHARNLWDRAVTILPRANQFWYKYTYMEEMLNNIPGCRAVFERWMEWEPDEQPWLTYIKFELRYKELDLARKIYERFVFVHPDIKNWIRFARFEESHGFINSARLIYERAVEFFGEEHMDEKLFIAFAKFEENQKEHDRARVIYKYALDNMDKENCAELFKAYTIHEKKFGERSGIENVILSKRKFQYEEEVKENPMNYDAWFDFIRLVESEGNVDIIRETYERAISNVPPSKEKHFWRRYIYLWINYAVYEELEAGDMERARQVYRAALDLLPHKRFTFAKLWLLYAQFEIRQKDVGTARRALGSALGKCPKAKLFRGYIDMEIQLREFTRCRTLYEKFLEFNPENVQTWMKFAELENLLGDVERARALYELAIGQPRLDMPEILWKAYIDFEIEQEETDRARDLYKRLLTRTQHVKVWLSFAQFELQVDHEDRLEEARHVYEDANKKLRQNGEKEERLMLLEAWKQFEKELFQESGDETSLRAVEKLMPRRVKKRRKIQSEDGTDQGWEEFFEYIFPEDEADKPNLKLLAMAKMWKKNKDVTQEAAPSEESSRPDDISNTADSSGDNNTRTDYNTADDNIDPENPDADDQDIVNESDSESSEDEQ